MNSIATVPVQILATIGFVVSGFLAPVAQASDGRFKVDPTVVKNDGFYMGGCQSADASAKKWTCIRQFALANQYGRGTNLYASCLNPSGSSREAFRPESFSVKNALLTGRSPFAMPYTWQSRHAPNVQCHSVGYPNNAEARVYCINLREMAIVTVTVKCLLR